MWKSVILAIFVFAGHHAVAQDKSFFAKGYLLHFKDTTPCRIWLNPDAPYFKADLTVWINDTSRIISLNRNDSLTGFGITETGYERHLGKIKAELPGRTVPIYVPKLVTGPVEIYEHIFMMTITNHSTEVTRKENYVNYYIGKTDSTDYQPAELVRSFTVKKMHRYFGDFSELGKIKEKKITPEQLIDLARAYNDWYIQKKQNGI